MASKPRLLDVWPLPGPPSTSSSSPSNDLSRDGYRTLWFLHYIFPTLTKIPQVQHFRRFFAELIMDPRVTRNTEWLTDLRIPKPLWPYITHAKHRIKSFIFDIPNSGSACEAANTIQDQFEDVRISGLLIGGSSDIIKYFCNVYDIFGDCWVVYYSNLSCLIQSQRGGLCRHCAKIGKPGYLMTCNIPFNEAVCTQPDCETGSGPNLLVRCHRCNFRECFMCAMKNNQFDWSQWPPKLLI